jgi:hypothetical protein
MATVASRIRPKNLVLRRQGFEQGAPDGVARCPAMQKKNRRATAGNAQVKLFAIVSGEGFHNESMPAK